MIADALYAWTVWQYGALAVMFFFAFFIKGAFGVGSLSPSILLGSLIIGPHVAVILALVANIASQVQFIGPGLRDGDLRLVRSIVVPNFVMTLLGVWIYGSIDPAPLMIVLGLTLGLVALAEMSGAVVSIAQTHDMTGWLPMSIMSGLAGLISGITGAGGIFLVLIVLRVLDLPPRTFRGTVLLLGLVFVGWRFLVMVFAGHITAGILIQVAVLAPFIVLGGFAGSRLFDRIEGQRFFVWLRILILFAAAATIVKGVQALSGT